MDVMTPSQRSRCMSMIHNSETGPELRLRRELWRVGLRYRLRCGLPGRPDIVFLKARVVVFVDGCFWHGCPIHSVKPKSNTAFWSAKLQKNRERDAQVTATLEGLGWRVMRVWEHEIEVGTHEAVNRIREAVRAKEWKPSLARPAKLLQRQ